MWILLVTLSLIIIFEFYLRYKDKKNSPLIFDIKNYPFYRYKKYTAGRQPWFLNRLGRKKTPIITISSDGIRGEIKKNGKDKILILGCSFTEGAGLPEEKTYPSILSTFLNSNKYEAINAGISGYGIFQILHLLESLIVHKPKIIIIQFLDFRRIPLDKMKIARAKLVLQNFQKLKKLSHALTYVYKKVLRNADYLSEPYYFHSIGLSNDDAWQANLKYLESISSICKREHIPVLFFQWPGIPFFSEKLREFSQSHGDYFCDPSEIYSYYKLEELQLDKNDSHPNELANRLIAKSLYGVLQKAHLVKE